MKPSLYRDLPPRWSVSRLKSVISKIESGTSVNAVDTPATDDEIGVLKTSCVYSGQFRPEENKAVVPEEYERASCPLVANTLVVSRMNTPELVGAAGLVRTAHANLYLPDRLWQVHFDGASPQYVHYWTLTPEYRAQVEMACAGTSASMQNLSQDEFRQFLLPVPELAEQALVARFLDCQTAKIDALVAEQEKLIALLKEKRQAVISHAVTKGLDRSAPMMDTGVEWLGQVPAHWEVKSIRHILYAMGDVDHFMPESVENGTPYLMTGDLRDYLSDVKLEDCKQVSRSDYANLSRKIRAAKGDVVLARYATIGTSMYVDVDVEFLVSYACVTLKTDPSEMSGMYLFQYLKSDSFRWGIEHKTNTNTQGNVGIKDLQDLKIAVPPTDEQATIVSFLHHETAKIDRLLAEAASAIDLLVERRSALISAAVTGKIDVRGAVELEPA